MGEPFKVIPSKNYRIDCRKTCERNASWPSSDRCIGRAHLSWWAVEPAVGIDHEATSLTSAFAKSDFRGSVPSPILLQTIKYQGNKTGQKKIIALNREIGRSAIRVL